MLLSSYNNQVEACHWIYFVVTRSFLCTFNKKDPGYKGHVAMVFINRDYRHYAIAAQLSLLALTAMSCCGSLYP